MSFSGLVAKFGSLNLRSNNFEVRERREADRVVCDFVEKNKVFCTATFFKKEKVGYISSFKEPSVSSLKALEFVCKTAKKRFNTEVICATTAKGVPDLYRDYLTCSIDDTSFDARLKRLNAMDPEDFLEIENFVDAFSHGLKSTITDTCASKECEYENDHIRLYFRLSDLVPSHKSAKRARNAVSFGGSAPLTEHE